VMIRVPRLTAEQSSDGCRVNLSSLSCISGAVVRCFACEAVLGKRLMIARLLSCTTWPLNGVLSMS
jgi:hypothetical protein